jgi:cell division protein FtsX
MRKRLVELLARLIDMSRVAFAKGIGKVSVDQFALAKLFAFRDMLCTIFIFCVFYILVAEVTLVHFQTQVPPSRPL